MDKKRPNKNMYVIEFNTDESGKITNALVNVGGTLVDFVVHNGGDMFGLPPNGANEGIEGYLTRNRLRFTGDLTVADGKVHMNVKDGPNGPQYRLPSPALNSDSAFF